MSSGKTVLLVAEDDPDYRLIFLRAFLATECHNNLRFVDDGEQLMECLMSSGYSESKVVVLDLNMPKIDGREALQQIRESPSLQLVPVVVLTTSDSREDVEYCKKLGVSGYFVKPGSFEGWLEIIEYLSTLC